LSDSPTPTAVARKADRDEYEKLTEADRLSAEGNDVADLCRVLQVPDATRRCLVRRTASIATF